MKALNTTPVSSAKSIQKFIQMNSNASEHHKQATKSFGAK